MTSTGNNNTDPFAEIRPYTDDEIRPVLDRLLEDDEFIRSLTAFGCPRLNRWLPAPARWLTRRTLRRQLRHVRDVSSMQDVIAGYMDKMIERTTTGLTNSGLDGLSPERPYLFISNHRDIAMDPAFVNYMLYHGGFDTLHIAIGDNLLKRPFVTDLMRLNKSFIVKRSLKGRELLKSSRQLSEYIHDCISRNNNIWIAQREGRAKDGVDRTETGLLKMLGMARRDLGLGGALGELNIVPVAISYEFDPCDALKAEELYQKEITGTYEKDENSDIHSIVTGMIGFKGHVHVAFGTPLTDISDDAEEVAQQIDRQLIREYRLQGTNRLGLEKLVESEPQAVPALQAMPEWEIGADSRQRFEERLAAVPPALRPYMLKMYANPVISRRADQDSDPFAEPGEDQPGTGARPD
ncbi:MAG: 1-acyl-sn-glycerol-3-phosphate acyltransferase [Pseudohongiellaceae bacterium]